MKIWIVKTGEPVPYLEEEHGSRFLRAGQMVQYLSARGHDVTWITGQFDHLRKVQRDVNANQVISTKEGAKLVFLPSRGYKGHVSPGRFFDHWQVGRAFRKLAPTLELPDIIVCAYPTIDLAYEVARFGERVGVPTVLDIRDLWPDVLEERLLDAFNFLPGVASKAIVFPYEYKAQRALRRATALMSITSKMLQWGQEKADRTRAQIENDFHIYQSKAIPAVSNIPSDSPVARHLENSRNSGSKVRLVWAGSIVPNTDGHTLIEAIHAQTPQMIEKLEFVICGRGSLAPQIEEAAQRIKNLKYFEWLQADELHYLLENSHIGLMCYLDRPDFHMSIPNKVVDYTAASLRILTNVRGELAALCSQYEGDLLLEYEVANTQSLLKVMEKICENAEQYLSLPKSSGQVFSDHFAEELVFSRFEEQLKRLANTSFC